MSNRDRDKEKKRVIPSRLVHMRNLTSKTQQELADSLAEIIYAKDENAQTPSNISISQWETNQKPVPQKYIEPICQVLGCTKEYLYGYSADPYSSERTEDVQVPIPQVEPVEITNLFKYDTYPVFVVFENMQYQNGWGILNYSTDRLVMMNAVLKLSSINPQEVSFYPMKPMYIPNISPNGGKKLDVLRALRADYVYIVMNSPDKTIRAMYDGIFHHNENHSCFINAEGLTLPYEGINKSYTVYEDIGTQYF